MNRDTSPTLDLSQLKASLRARCAEHGVPVETRARLVLAVALLAGPVFAAGQPVRVTEEVDPSGPLLVITLRLPENTPVAGADLPLVPEPGGPGVAVWRIPVPQVPPAPDYPAETAAEQELAAVLARLDGLEREQWELKHELAETNSGVLAMYVQLEERDEQLRRSHAQIFQQLEDALRPPPPVVPGVDLAVHYTPAEADAPTGGDLYDWFVLPDGSLHITVVDAVGHGVASTRNALHVTHAVRTLTLEGYPLGELVERTATALRITDPRLMATVLLARLDPRTGRLELANGSHPPALLVRAGGGAEYLTVPGRGVGFPLPGSFEVRTETLAEGDLLLLHTDGLTECRGDAEEGEARLLAAAEAHAALPVGELTETVVAGLRTVVTHTDDTLLLAARYRPAPSAR
ncbi:PP2C family protein-serine/threonine phosphatase [Crossiella sp. NPDC003009]